MTKGRPIEQLKLSEYERQKLELIASRPKSSQRDALRATIVLACATGIPNQEVAQKLGINQGTVGKWRSRFLKSRLDGLVDQPRSGAPRTIDDKKVEEIVTKTLQSVPKGKTHWSTRTMAKEVGVHADSIHRIWKAFGLKPHLTKTFKVSKDPMFVEKVRDIIGLYMSPPEKAIVLCVDEKSQTQALERSQPILPMDLGMPERQTHDYIRHGTTSLFAALNVLTGEVIGKCHSKHRQQEFLKFLNLIDDLYSDLPDHEIHFVMDNYATHKTPKVRRWFQKRPRYHVHFTPTGSSWINQIERWFGKITTECIRRGSFSSVNQLIQAIYQYTEIHNKDPKPFSWTATPDSIFKKLKFSLS